MSTVLIIDDDPAFLDAMHQILAAPGYRVLRAMDGNEAVQLLEQHHALIDLAIIDLALPGLNGFEIIGAIARRPNSIKMIATTGLYKEAQLEVAGALGAHAVIRKPAAGSPLPVQEWLAVVRKLIGPPAQEISAHVNGGEENADNPEASHAKRTHQ